MLGDRGDRHPADRVDRERRAPGGARPATRGLADAAARSPRRTATIVREDRQRDLGRACGRRCRSRPARRSARAAPRGRRRRAARRARRRRACGWRRGRRTARRPRARGAACAARRARARRRRARGRRPPARAAAVDGDDVEPELGAERAGPPPRSACRRRRARAAPAAPARGRSRSRRRTGTGSARSRRRPRPRSPRPVPGSSPIGPSGTIRNSTASSVSIAFSEYTRTLCCAQTPPTKPSIVPSPSTSATSPAFTLVGRCARTTVAVTNAVPSAASSCARRDTAALIIAVARGAPASPPRRGPGCRACRCGRRRASRAARR